MGQDGPLWYVIECMKFTCRMHRQFLPKKGGLGFEIMSLWIG